MRSRAWYIQPQMDVFNAVLAFKNFSSPDDVAVMVISYQSTNKSTTQHVHGNLGDFELIIEDTIGVVIFVPLHQNRSTDFVLNYYSGCEFLSANQDQVNYVDSQQYDQKKCWLVNPKDNGQIRRFYFSIRDVNLNSGQEIAIWDIHTTNLIATASSDTNEEVIAAEPSEYAVILVDMICTKNVCKSDAANSFIVSYYAMTQADLDCQQIQRECFERKITPDTNCNTSCPAFDNMIIEEYGLQAKGNASAVLRSGVQQFNQGAEAQNRYCPWGEQQCSCLRRYSSNPKRFCDLRCFRITKHCAFACVYHKMITCIRIKLLESIILL